MKKILECRRSSLALVAMVLLFILAWKQGVTATEAIAYPLFLLSGGVAAANALEKIKNPKV